MAITRTDSRSAGAVSEVSVTLAPQVLGATRYVTAVRESGGDLKLIAWTVDDGEITRRGDASAGAVSMVKVAGRQDGSVVATAVRDSAGNLKVIQWVLGGDLSSNIFRRGDASAGAVSLIALDALPTNALGSLEHRFVTAVRDSGGDLKVVIWDTSIAPGIDDVFRRGDDSAGAISEVAVASAGTDCFVVAVRDGDGNLKVIVYDVTQNGTPIRRGDETAGAASQISISALDGDRVFVGVRDGDGNLRVIVWDINAGGVPIRRGQSVEGAVSLVQMAGRVAIVRDSGGELKAIEYQISGAGNITRIDDHASGAVSRIAMDGRLAAVRDAGGDLKVIAYDLN